MDILTHTLSGVAAGTAVSGFSPKGFFKKLAIITAGAAGGALPDLDAISLWSRFDSIIGEFFNLSHTGKQIYFSKFWYSHHGFLHSLTAGILLSIILGLLLYFFNSVFSKDSGVNKLIIFSFAAGFVIHLLEDMPTPCCVWGGVNLFWPDKTYIGGTGDIWWWNNYDIFLIVFGVILINLILLCFNGMFRGKLRKFTVVVFCVGLILSVSLIKTRGFDFNYFGHTAKYQDYEKKSKEIQRQVLGDKLYLIMEKFDNKIRLNF